MTTSIPINWNSETEVCLFYAMRGHKPVGINKHFHMMCIHRKFCESLGQPQPVTCDQLWDHLKTMYNLKALDESEISPFKTTKSEFKLPDDILHYQKYQSKSTSEESIVEEAPAPKQKPGRKRRHGVNTASPSSPATTTVKRRRVWH